MISTKIQLHILQFQASRKNAAQGFTMIEVLVGILLTFVFTMIAMQAMVTATAIKVRADELTESSKWIQQDREVVVRIANELNYDSTNSTYPISTAATNHRSYCTATTSGAGYATKLKDDLDAIPISETRSAVGNRQYTLTRTTVASSVSPFNVLQITYRVYRGTDTSNTAVPISNLYTEVIPGASLSCRQTAGS
jgi:Tfp pilus assembly protein PilV